MPSTDNQSSAPTKRVNRVDHPDYEQVLNRELEKYGGNGTTTLFAALNVLDGEVIAQCQQSSRGMAALPAQDRPETPKGKTLHLICDNYATHKHPNVQAWLEKHPRFHVHFTPTSASWLNMVERFFRDISANRLRRGVFTSVPELTAAIEQYVAHHNANPKPFIPLTDVDNCRGGWRSVCSRASWSLRVLSSAAIARLRAIQRLHLAFLVATQYHRMRGRRQVQAHDIGYDDIELASWGAYKLTTVRHPMEEMVAHAIKLLLAKIANRDKALDHQCFPSELVIRRSTGRQPLDGTDGNRSLK